MVMVGTVVVWHPTGRSTTVRVNTSEDAALMERSTMVMDRIAASWMSMEGSTARMVRTGVA